MALGPTSDGQGWLRALTGRVAALLDAGDAPLGAGWHERHCTQAPCMYCEAPRVTGEYDPKCETRTCSHVHPRRMA